MFSVHSADNLTAYSSAFFRAGFSKVRPLDERERKLKANIHSCLDRASFPSSLFSWAVLFLSLSLSQLVLTSSNWPHHLRKLDRQALKSHKKKIPLQTLVNNQNSIILILKWVNIWIFYPSLRKLYYEEYLVHIFVIWTFLSTANCITRELKQN